LILALLALLASAPDPFQVRVFPRISMPGQELTLTVEHVGEVTEATYCLGVEVLWGKGTTSKHEQDCEPWEEFSRHRARAAECDDMVIVCPPGYECFLPSCREAYEAVGRLQRRWTFSTRQRRVPYGPGDYNLPVRFYLPNGKTVDRYAPFLVAGGEVQ
jgi:hypothetical protein